MGVFDFVKEAGAKIGIGESQAEKEEKAAAEAAAEAARREKAVAATKERVAEQKKRMKMRAADEARAERAEALEESKRSARLEAYVNKLDIEIKDLDIRFDDGVATITGEAATQEAKERCILAVGNCHGVGTVEESITVAAPSEESRLHVVEAGDTLWAIATEYLGDGSRYPEVFEANTPMLSDPDLIFPGQVLRIPAT